jgi:putative peptidoglycan lipid II flippase
MRQAVRTISNLIRPGEHSSPLRKIFGAALIVGFSSVLVKLLGFVKDLITAWSFGTNASVDAFFMSTLIPSLVINILSSSLTPAILPAYIKVKETKGEAEATLLISSCFFVSVAISLLATILMVLTAPYYLPYLGLGFSKTAIDEALNHFYILSGGVFLACVSSLLVGILSAVDKFFWAALTPSLLSVSTIIFLFFSPQLGAYALSISMLVGFALQLFVLIAFLFKSKVNFVLSFKFSEELRGVLLQFLPALAGAILMCSASTIDKGLAGSMASGSVASLNYADRLVVAFLGLASTAMTTGVIPHFSRMAARSDWKGIWATLHKSLAFIMLTTVPLVVFIFFFSHDLVGFFYEKGSFTKSDTDSVSIIQKMYALQIPFYLCSLLCVRLISSVQKNQFLVVLSAINLTVNVVLDIVFLKIFGLKGIALATSAVYLISFLTVYGYATYLFKKKLGR